MHRVISQLFFLIIVSTFISIFDLRNGKENVSHSESFIPSRVRVVKKFVLFVRVYVIDYSSSKNFSSRMLCVTCVWLHKQIRTDENLKNIISIHISAHFIPPFPPSVEEIHVFFPRFTSHYYTYNIITTYGYYHTQYTIRFNVNTSPSSMKTYF